MKSNTNKVINYAFRALPLPDDEKYWLLKNYSNYSDDLKETLKTKKVRPVVGKMMLSLGVDTDYWAKEYNFFLNRNKTVIKEIDDVFKTLHEGGVARIFAYENFGALLSSGSDD